MPSPSIVKVIASEVARGSKRKHNTDNERPAHSRKSSKLGQQTLQQPDDITQGFDNFKFLALPSEVRNQIYEYATEHTYRCFPLLHGTPKTTVGRRVLRSSNSTDSLSSNRKPIPYLGLTQVCLQIRAEFRPMWLSTHRIRFKLTDSYFKAFFVARVPKVTRSNIFGLTTSNLRIWVRKDDLGTVWNGCEVTRLFRHKARFPSCVIECQSLPEIVAESTLRQLERLINHDTSTWREAIHAGKFSQLRLCLQNDKKTPVMHVVIKERFSEPWMKIVSKRPSLEDMARFFERFGLETDVRWEARVSVDYS